MRKLHPVGSHEMPIDSLTVNRADGGAEMATVHRLPGHRLIVRVEVSPPASASLWHLMLDADGRPERLEARLESQGGPVDVTLTFFEDEVLVWRRGSDPATEAVAIPPGYRLWWPPFAGREHCLAGVLPSPGRDALMTCLVRLTSPARGSISVRAVKFTITRTDDALTLATPGLPVQTVRLDAEGHAARWLADEVEVGVREPMSAHG